MLDQSLKNYYTAEMTTDVALQNLTVTYKM